MVEVASGLAGHAYAVGPLWSVGLGGILAMLGGFIAQEYASVRQRQRTKKLLSVLILDEVMQICSIMDRLIEAYGKTTVVYVTYLLELENARKGYDRNSDWIILFDDALRQDIAGFFSREQLARSYLQAIIQLLATRSELQAWGMEEIRKQVDELKNLRQVGLGIREQLRST